MILKTLTLEDFGVYSGRQILDLDPTAEAPIVLIGGQNGEGKTTLLEAVLHVLYGPHAGPIIGRAGGYENYLRSTINHRADPVRGAAVELEIETVRDGTDVEICVRRSWQVEQSQVREQLTVSVDGTFDRALTDGWADFVETLIPRGVAPLFFFDGEQIEALADLEGAASTIKAAVGSLLGLDLVEQLRSDLLALERRHAPSAASGELRAELERAESAAAESDTSLTEVRNRMASARTELDQAEGQLRRAVEEFKREGGDIYESRVEIEAEVASARQRITDARDHLRELAAGYAPLLLCSSTIDSLLSRAREEEAQAVGANLVGTLEDRDADLLKWIEANGVSTDSVTSRLEAWLSEDRERRLGNREPAVLDMDRTALRLLEGLDVAGFAEIRLAIRAGLDELEKAKAEGEQVERRMAQIPSTEAINSVLLVRDETIEARDLAASAMKTLALEYEAAERERERRHDEREKVLRRVAEMDLSESDGRRILEHAEKARKTLLELREQSVARHMGRIEELIMESLAELLRKERLIEQVKIDPKTYRLELFGRSGRQIAPKDLSAGERQLTALSLLWGLARAADRPLPLIIDTPLGRLDATHRRLMLTRYLPKASHQVVVLSTDTEVDAEALGLLEGAVSRTYRLEHSDNDQGTTVSPGYLFDELELAA